MKLAFYHNLPSGGALRHLRDVMSAMKNRGHEIHLYTPTCAEKAMFHVQGMVDRHVELPLETWQEGSSWLNPLRYVLHLLKAFAIGQDFAARLESEKYDGIYLGQCRIWTEPSVLYYLGKNIPTILYCAEPKRSFYEPASLQRMKEWPWHKKIWRRPLVNWMKRRQLQSIVRAGHVFCNSEFSRANIAKAYPGVDAEVCRIGTDVDFFCPGPGMEREDILLSVGALDPSKNHQMALQVAALRPAGRNFAVHVVTDREHGQTRDELEKLAGLLKVSLQIHTRVSDLELRDMYRKSRVLIYCPRMEPFGMVSTEAQACGLPVLGLDEGGLRESIQNGKGGYRLPLDPALFCGKLSELLANENVFQALSRDAREQALQHWDKKILLEDTAMRIEQIFTAAKS